MNDAVPRALVAASVIDPTPVRSNPTVAPLAPDAPAMLAVTVHVALGDPPDAVALVTVGGLPVTPLVTRPKSVVATPVTGSEKVTIHDNGPVLVGDAPARTNELTVGAVVSMTRSLLAPREPGAPGAGSVSVASLPAPSLIDPPAADRAADPE